MVNTSAFIGRKLKGIKGGIVAAVGSTVPSLVIITLIAMFLSAFTHYSVVQDAFAGVRVCVVILIVNAVVKLWKSAMVDWKCFFLIFLPICALSLFTGRVSGAAGGGGGRRRCGHLRDILKVRRQGRGGARGMILTLLRLFWEFFKIGIFAVGGGMAALPFLYDLADSTEHAI